jgi:hypothetical protein
MPVILIARHRVKRSDLDACPIIVGPFAAYLAASMHQNGFSE